MIRPQRNFFVCQKKNKQENCVESESNIVYCFEPVIYFGSFVIV